jgi:DNA repair exonuclease SbcCD ATPase subunit
MATQTSDNQRQTLLSLVGGHHQLVVCTKQKLAEQRQELLALLSAVREHWLAPAGTKAAEGFSAQPPSRDAAVREEELAKFETELHDYRRHLERDRQYLDDEWEELQTQQAEFRDIAKQTEVELSRERAQIARERTELVRLREEIRQELERVQRYAEVDERLAPVQRLQEEMTERHRTADPSKTTPSPMPRKNNGSRWQIFLGKLDELKS